MKIFHIFFILLVCFAHQTHHSAPNIFECRHDEMLVNHSVNSNSQNGMQAIVANAFKERRLCAQRQGATPAMMNELHRYYTQQQDRVLYAIMALENAESECRLEVTNFNDSFDLRNFLTQAFNARVEDCAATTRWTDSTDKQEQMNSMVENYRKAWKDLFPAVSDALDESQTTESSTTKQPENDQVEIWKIIAIALFCSNCLFVVALIVSCLRKSKNRSVHPPAHTITNDENVRQPQAWEEIPVYKSDRPLVTPLYGSRNVSVDMPDHARR